MRKLHRRLGAIGAPHHQAHALALADDAGQVILPVMGEGGRRLLVALWQRRPGLDAEQPVRGLLDFAALALRVHDATSGRHQVHLARHDRRRGAEAVAMPHFALEQIGDRGEPDMRVRPHVDAVTDQEFGRPHLVEENERADHLFLCRRQRAAHFEAAEIAGARHDHVLDGIAGKAIAGNGVLAGLPAHASHPFW